MVVIGEAESLHSLSSPPLFPFLAPFVSASSSSFIIFVALLVFISACSCSQVGLNKYF